MSFSEMTDCCALARPRNDRLDEPRRKKFFAKSKEAKPTILRRRATGDEDEDPAEVGKMIV